MRTVPSVMLALAIGCGPASADVDLNVMYKSYEVQGLSAEEIHLDIDRRSASDEEGIILGSADDSVDWDIQLEPTGGSCKVRRADIKLQVEITLPVWTDHARAAAEVRAAWGRYYAKLRAHELRHKDIAVEFARELEAVLIAAERSGSCEALRRDLELRAEQILAREERVQSEFDKSESEDALIELR